MGLAPLSRAAAESQDVIAGFLRQKGWAQARQTPVQEDFSGRLYLRLHNEPSSKAILMRMRRPEELAPFANMQRLLSACGLRVPEIFAVEEASGIALLEDFGDARFDRLLDQGKSGSELYPIAVDVLINLHNASRNPDPAALHVPHFNEKLFLEQVSLFLDVFGSLKPGGFSDQQRAEFVKAWDALKPACAVPSSLILRDYHAANILYLPSEQGHRRAGVIDFQDGGVGPITYDLASLLEDARRDVDSDLRNELIAYYLKQRSGVDAEEFRATYPIIAAERHMRVIAITAKRWMEKGDELAGAYCQRSWRLLDQHRKAAELAPLFQWLDINVPENLRQDSLRS
jgi:aminoglycoside/choline kinase family phosphotransferase